MIEAMVAWASEPGTAKWVLAVGVAALLVEATRQSRTALWGDFFAEDGEED